MTIKYKPYLQKKSTYKGGKSIAEVSTKAAKIYKLSSNENPLGSSPKALAAIKKATENLSQYPDRTDERFRLALEAFYGRKVLAHQFVTTNSGLANIELIMNAFLEEGTECIYSSPAFSAYPELLQKTGAIGIDIPLKGDAFELDVAGVLQAINEQTRLILLTSPNNPTGTHIPKNQVDKLVENLPNHVILVYDEVYYQYIDVEDYVRAYEYVQRGKNVIGLNSFSKAYGLAGLRVGYSYSTPEIAGYLQQLRRPFMLNSIALEAAIAALKDEAFIQKTVAHVHQEKAFLYSKLDEMDCKYWKTQGNFFLLQPNMSPAEFEHSMLQEGIMVRNAIGFNAPDCVRVTIGTREANECFISALKKLYC